MSLRRVDPAGRRGLGPLLAQEVEIVGGLAGELVATPLVQLGTIAVVLVFLASEHAALALVSALAAIANVVALRPLQRRTAALARERVGLVRGLNADLIDAAPVRRIVADCTALERVRLRHARMKFLTKLTANLMIGTTPLLLVGVGGWLALEGRVSLGGVVAAVIASRDIGPSIRAMVAFEQMRIDASARFVAMAQRGLKPARRA
jgi:energy-converting hydrogenase Eha subunit E